jgi:uncharacterized protein DUF3108
MRTLTLRMFTFLFLLSLITAFSVKDTSYRVIKNYSFGAGEKLKYRVHYSLFNAAEATMVIGDEVHRISGRPCYKIDVIGKSTGMFDLIMHVRDVWGTYIDTAAVIPHRFYRYLEEGKYRKNEVVDFDYKQNLAITKIYEKHDRSKLKKKLEHKIPMNVQDMISGYYYMRTLDYSTMKRGDTTTITGFFDEEVFQLQIKFKGRQTLRTKLGKIRSIVIEPIMPENEFFDGKNAILIWLSDDKNKIPLKIKARMFIGAIEIDIKSHKGLRNPLMTQ